MIRPPLSPRRPLAVAAAALAGLVTALAVSSPAIATNPSPSASASATASTPLPTRSSTPQEPTCVSAADARYTHTFDGAKGEASITLTNGPLCEGEKQDFALVSYVAPSARFAVPQYLFDKSVKAFAPVPDGEIGTVAKLEFKVAVPTCFTQVDFVFGSEVIDPLVEGGKRYDNRKVGSPAGIGARSEGPAAWYNGGEGTCVAEPAVEATYDCTGSATLTLVNRGNVAAVFAVTGSGELAEKVTVAAGKFEKLELTEAQAKEITVAAEGMQTWQGGWEQPEDCQQPEVGKPTISHATTCEELILKVANPEDGISLTSTFTPSTGEPKTVTFAPGTTKTVTFPAAEGLSVVFTGDLESAKPIAWTAPKGGCDEGGEGGGLPVTGAAAGGIAAGAVALLALGAVLFVVARRRRVRFTA
ncbi:cell wall anchor protein [Micromonospora sp. NPDC047812]|uniref:cell wall anchor protein n=1 Tax=Micromonospora sp. NPDC047812 TaxID=3155742 RepID=UPI0034538F30